MVFRSVISYRSFFGTAESLVILGAVFFSCSYSAYAQAGQVLGLESQHFPGSGRLSTLLRAGQPYLHS